MSAALRRPKQGRMVAGVIAGLADRFNIERTLARVIYVVLSIVSVAFPGILVYLILWFVIPEEG